MSTLKPVVLAAAALTVTAHAGDKEVLDLLVKKGVITAEERAKAIQESKTKASAAGIDRVFPRQDTTKRLTFSGYVQTQYQSFDYSQTVGGVEDGAFANQGGFLMRRLYLEFLADIGEGFSANVVADLSGNTTSSSTSWLDRALASKSFSWGTLDVGYKKVAWGYEESTLSSLFKASSSSLHAVERGITNRYWNESENGTRLGFGAHHTGLHFSSSPTPQGLECGVSVVNPSQGRNSEGQGGNNVATYANIAFNWKVSDTRKYAVGVNAGRTQFYSTDSKAAGMMTGYSPFVQAQVSDLTFMGEMFSTKVEEVAAIADTSSSFGKPANGRPVGYNATLAYRIDDNWEGVARYTYLDSDGRGQKISDGERGFNKAIGGNADALFDRSDAIYIGLNYYFTLSVAGSPVAGHNAKFQIGYEMAGYSDQFKSGTKTGSTYAAGAYTSDGADVGAIRAQFQVSF